MFHAQKVSILLTFFMGMVAGAYLYLTGFATTFKLPEVTTDNIYKEFVITVESYGDCTDAKTCLSFQVLENGSFRAVYDSPTLSQREVKEGRIPLALRRAIKENLTPTNLQLNTVPLGTPECRYEGNNYRFRISLNQVDYRIDTCVSDVDYDGKTWRSLADLWNFVSTTK